MQEQLILLSAKNEGPFGNLIQLNVSKSVGGGIDLVGSGARLAGGSDARELPAGTFASVFGTDFSDTVHNAKIEGGRLPTELGGVSVYATAFSAR